MTARTPSSTRRRFWHFATATALAAGCQAPVETLQLDGGGPADEAGVDGAGSWDAPGEPDTTDAGIGTTDASRVADVGPGCNASTMPPMPPFSEDALAANPRPDSKTWQPWTSGHPIAVHGNHVLALDADNGTLVRIDRTSLAVVAKVQVGARPWSLTVAPDGTAFVAVRGAGSVVRVAPGGTVAATWLVGTEPMGVALSPDAATVYVTLAGDHKLLALDAATGAVKGQAVTGDHPTAVVARPGAVVVLDRVGPPLQFLTGPLLAGGTAPAVALKLNGAGMVGHCGDVVPAIRALAGIVDPSHGSVHVAHVRAAPGNLGTSISQAKNLACTEGGGSYGAGGSCKVARRPVEVAVSILLGTHEGGGSAFSQVGTSTGEQLASHFDQPNDIAAHPSLGMLLVAARGTDNVAVLATDGGLVRMLGEIAVGQAPTGIAVTDEGDVAYVLNSQDFTVGVVTLQPLLAFTGGKAPHLKQGATVAIGTDPLPQPLRLGRRTFTFAGNPALSKKAVFACATCHTDGAEDGQTWFVATGPRQTPALAERLAGTAPFNWQGSHQVLTENMAETIQRMGGTGLTQAELASLEAFMTTGLHAPINPHLAPGGLTAQQAEGKKLFEDPKVACNGCHVDGKTDGMSHDVGTMSIDDFTLYAKGLGKSIKGLEFDTPSLKGLFASAPYLHDGSAVTLNDVLKLSDAGKMGSTSHLTAAQKVSLMAYLLTL